MKQIIKFARRQRRARVAFRVAAWLIFLGVLWWTISQTYVDHTLGSGGLLSRLWESISTGTLATRPDLFLLPSDKYFETSGELLFNLPLMILVLFVAVAWITMFALLISIAYVCAISGPDGKKITNRYVKLLWPRMANRCFICRIDGVTFAVYVVGKSLVVIEDAKLPEFFMDPTNVDTFRREKRRLAFAQADEFITDHTTSSHVTIYVSEQSQVQLLPFFDKELRAFMIKQLKGSVVASDGRSVAYIIDSLAIKDHARLYRTLQSFAEFSRLTKRKSRARSSSALSAKPQAISAWPLGLNVPVLATWITLFVICLLAVLVVAMAPGSIDLARLELLMGGVIMSILIRRCMQFAQRGGL